MRNPAILLGAAVIIGATPPPRQSVPLAKPMCDSAGHGGISNRIIVQGGSAPSPLAQGAVADGRPGAPLGPRPGERVAKKVGGDGDPAALGPKQDDPGPPPPADLSALGPKQDDPGPPPNPDAGAIRSCKVRPG